MRRKTFAQDDVRFDQAYKTLTTKQKDVYETVYVCGKSLKEYAKDNHISPSGLRLVEVLFKPNLDITPN